MKIFDSCIETQEVYMAGYREGFDRAIDLMRNAVNTIAIHRSGMTETTTTIAEIISDRTIFKRMKARDSK